MSIFDFNRDGEVSSSEQAFGLGAILAALSETEAEVKITIKASTGGDEDYESMDRDELESLLEELQEQREDLEDEEPDSLNQIISAIVFITRLTTKKCSILFTCCNARFRLQRRNDENTQYSGNIVAECIKTASICVGAA